MAISTTYKGMLKDFDPNRWNSEKEFEQYWLQRISETMADTNYYTGKDGKEVVISPVTHHPILKEYEVWSEGYSATGEHSGCIFEGKATARNFAQACDIVMCKKHLEWIEKVNHPEYRGYEPPRKWDYDPNKLSVWACRLFWSKELASKSFG